MKPEIAIAIVYTADLGHGPQPVRFLEACRLWSIDRRYSGLVVAHRTRRRTPEPSQPVGNLAVTRHFDPGLPHAYPPTPAGRNALAAALRDYPLPRLPDAPRAAASAVYALLPELADAGLGVALVSLTEHLGERWNHFSPLPAPETEPNGEHLA